MFEWKGPCNRRVGSRGICRVPNRFHRMLGIDDQTGGVLRWEATGENEIRLTPGHIKDNEKEGIRRTPSGSIKSGIVMAAEKFVDECIVEVERGRMDVKAVQDEYRAWLRMHPSEDDRPSDVYMGRALKQKHLEARRSARIGPRGELIPVYKNIGIVTVYGKKRADKVRKDEEANLDELLEVDEEIRPEDREVGNEETINGPA